MVSKATGSANWEFGLVLSNISLKDPVEHKEVAIVPSDEPRLLAICSRNPTIEKLRTSFTDAFGRKRKPSFLIVRGGSKLNGQAIVAFRNVFAMSCMLKAWKRGAKGVVMGPVYSDYFDFYPIRGASETHLLFQSPALWGAELNIDEFVGQTSPSLPGSHTLFFDLDQEYYDALLVRWEHHFIRDRRPKWPDRGLFRSIETAYNAASTFKGNESSLYDFGARISLWVAAIEMLFHPRIGNVTLSIVLRRFAEAKWWDKRMKDAQRYTIEYKQRRREVNLVQRLYWDLYRVRNKFLHGDRITKNDEHVLRNPRRVGLARIAPLVYMVALKCFMRIPTPFVETDDEYGAGFDHADLEEALSTVWQDRDPDD